MPKDYKYMLLETLPLQLLLDIDEKIDPMLDEIDRNGLNDALSNAIIDLSVDLTIVLANRGHRFAMPTFKIP